MKAVILAGGEGSRLRPLTSTQPKPMLPMANRPIMEHIVQLLKRHGFDEIVATVAYLSKVVQSYFGDGSEFGVRMVYATEDTPLGTAGAVRNAIAELNEPFLVIAGDVVTDCDLTALCEEHTLRKADVTVALKAMEDPLEFGIVITREDSSIDRFLEKPTWTEVFSDRVNTGIYVVEPSVLDTIEPDQFSDFSNDVFPELLRQKRPLFGHTIDGYWSDVGTLESYRRTHQDVLDGAVRLDVPGFQLGGGTRIGEGAEVDPGARIEGPVIIGDYTHVEAGAHLREYTVIGANVRVGAEAFLERAIVHDNVFIGPGARLRGAIVGRRSELRRASRLEDDVVVADEVRIGEHAVINPTVKIYPYKTVESGAIVNSSIVWESKGTRGLFGESGISGLANVDISPEFATKVAMAFATTLRKGSTITVARDTSRAARVLKRAAMVGMNASGVDVDDLGAASVPLTRFTVRAQRSRGGMCVHLGDDPQSVVLRFFDSDGLDLSEPAHRKIERLFYREDLRRVVASDIGDINYPVRAREFYTSALMDSVDAEAIRKASFKVVLDYSYGSTSFVMPNVLAKLGAEVLAVNPFGSTASMLGSHWTEHVPRVAELVRASGAVLGAVIDPSGEKLVLVADNGQVLSHTETTLTLLRLVGMAEGHRRVVLPVAASSAAELVCEESELTLSWSRLDAPAIMKAAERGDVALAATLDGGYAFPVFHPAIDAVAAFVHVLELLARTGVTLASAASDLPRRHLIKQTLGAPWEQKSALMRRLVESVSDQKIVLVDGVKVLHDDGWALVFPDSEQALVHVWAEAANEAQAGDRVHDYARRLRNMLR